MKLLRRKFLQLTAGATALSLILLTLSGQSAWNQTTRTIKIVVPFPPGASGDILARVLAEHVARTQGATIVVENHPGAATVIATEAVSRAAPDGNTLLVNASSFVINPHVRKVNYDPLASFEPICHLVNFPNLIVVNSASPYRTLADLLDAARAKPGDLTLASIGPASTTHIAFEMLKRAAKVDMTFVPYTGNAPAVTALLGGHVTAAFADYAVLLEQLKAGKLRALVTQTRTRIDTLPEVPTFAESGYKNFEGGVWFGLVAPAKTPQEKVSQLAGWFTSALQVPEVKAKLVVQGLYPVGTCGAEFSAYIRTQYSEFGRVISEANIKAQ
jgi:tripartite-type tricarboxylate transporter receptor subunit TctC